MEALSTNKNNNNPPPPRAPRASNIPFPAPICLTTNLPIYIHIYIHTHTVPWRMTGPAECCVRPPRICGWRRHLALRLR